jgi:diaminopimelate epimerase
MSIIHFQKWQGAGNDFIIIDNRDGQAGSLSPQSIKRLCDRHFGIGADGLMLIGLSPGFDFEMIFYNSDGNPAEMCGNGGRCIAAMAWNSGIFHNKANFLTTDGPHEALVIGPDLIRLRMADVPEIENIDLSDAGVSSIPTGVFLNTGVPHLVVFVPDPERIDVDSSGRRIRNLQRFAPAGTNVNFVKADGRTLHVRTYERGVEAETLACGTGNVAAALAAEWTRNNGFDEYDCFARGGRLKVSFTRAGKNLFSNVWLEGPAVKVFEGEVEV